MKIQKLLTGPHQSQKQSLAVVVCVEMRYDELTDQDPEVVQLAAHLQALAAKWEHTKYDGCDCFSSETCFYLFSKDPDGLASAVLQIVCALSLQDRARVRVSLDPPGGAWRNVVA